LSKDNEIIKFSKKLSFLYLFFGIIGFAMIMLPMVFYNSDKIDSIGTIGDAVGGILNPIIAIGAALLTFLAFYIQYQANEEVRKQFKIQQFESQFYEMIRLHKENVNEMKIVGYEPIIETSIQKNDSNAVVSKTETITISTRVTEGRKVFVTMATELIACYEILEYYNHLWDTKINQFHLLELAYQFFFFGSKSEIVSSKNINKQVIENFRIELNRISKLHKNSSGVKNKIMGLNGKAIKLYFKYTPFSGHENRLGHFYRHLYSTVKYVVKKEKNELFDYQQSREYLKILRSQMSNDEQLMLYYNYIIGFGRDWENDENKFFSDYRMLHNLPVDSVKYVENPRVYFKNLINKIKEETNGKEEMFEWGDTKQ
jgi:hypothetical protein